MTNRIPAEVFPPGEYIKDELEERGWTQLDLAEILGRPLQLVSEIILGKRGISPETARGLAEAFGTSAQLWLNLDAAWQLYNSRSATPDPTIALRARIYSKVPIKELVKRGWIEYSSNPEVLEQRVLDFLSIKSLEETPRLLPVAARMSASYDALSQAQAAWVCRARDLARAVPVSGKFNPSASEELVQRLRILLRDPEEVRHVPRILGESGIRFLVIEHLAKTKIDGACLWLDKASPVIAMSLRYDRVDYFWFTLMHEIRHASNGDGWRNALLALDIKLVGEDALPRDEKPEIERAADAFAEQALIPSDELEDFVVRKGPLFSEMDIRGFASLLRIHPGLVVGQLQHRKAVSYSKFRPLLARVRDFLVQSALTDGWGHSAPAMA
jgi:HTH-type transcriptional regulator/antitoxin HigA